MQKKPTRKFDFPAHYKHVSCYEINKILIVVKLLHIGLGYYSLEMKYIYSTLSYMYVMHLDK